MPIHAVHVEDDKPLKDILKYAFQATSRQFRLLQFTTGDAAIPYIQDNMSIIALVVIDIRLPGTLNGIQIAEKIRELGCQAHIILTSAYERPKLELLERLRCEYYPKPWHLADIVQKLLDCEGQDSPAAARSTPPRRPGK
jgi:DNA-binding response OmpR family regulator